MFDVNPQKSRIPNYEKNDFKNHAPTSDIWQREEFKYLKSFEMGPDAYFVDEVEFDDSTQNLQSQINFTIVNPSTGKAIGAVSSRIAADNFLK